ncbi:hypothetical protein LWC05_12260 [Acetobacter sicerae]|uniref:Uncharacterized protein n=1 Tax=Acetobacter sicerae TaxID=85325 RepID=A0ABS8VX02_9PROT|nr:hypothetical protein [Acetobacter sicerae]MCE0744656.1 hypothetical protein [Acetobacter sicerae]
MSKARAVLLFPYLSRPLRSRQRLTHVRSGTGLAQIGPGRPDGPVVWEYVGNASVWSGRVETPLAGIRLSCGLMQGIGRLAPLARDWKHD